MELVDVLFYLFCAFGFTIIPLVAIAGGWGLVRGTARSRENAKYFVAMIFWILISFWGRSYFKEQECVEFQRHGYSSRENCEEQYRFLDFNPDAPRFRGD
jgi:hypothetical protein